MAFTYDLNNATGTVRLLIPDKDIDAHELEDAEIVYFLSDMGNNVKAAAVAACRWLARKYAQKASFTADGLTMKFTERAQAFAARAEELAKGLQGGVAAVELDRRDGFASAAQEGEYGRWA